MDKVEPDVFLPLLRRHITGPLDSMMRSALIEAAIQFCRKSRYLVDSLTISGVVAGQDITICSDIDLKSSDIQSVLDKLRQDEEFIKWAAGLPECVEKETLEILEKLPFSP